MLSEPQWWVDGSEPYTFYQLWGTESWQRRRSGSGAACWGDGALADIYFAAALSNRQLCDANWLEGAAGGAHERPLFPRAVAPALLGFDGDIHRRCSELAGLGSSRVSGAAWNAELAVRCIQASRNVLRIGSGASYGWTMCVNLNWLLCAARGWLPGQGGTTLQFARAPGQLDIRDYNEPCVPTHRPHSRPAVSPLVHACISPLMMHAPALWGCMHQPFGACS